MTNLYKLGKSIYEYFLQRTEPNEHFKLCIDAYTYEHCAKVAGLRAVEIMRLLRGDGLYSIYDNDFCALGIAALEIKIAYDVETDSDLINSYNNRIPENIKDLPDINSVEMYYRESQDILWQKVKNLFKSSKRILDIPAPKQGKGRYVQYPLSQRIISGMSIIRYADNFINLGLEPCSGITYKTFSDLIFNQNEFKYNEMVRRMVFSFYCMWDGRTTQEIYTRTRITKEQRLKQEKKEIFIQLQPNIKLFINRKEINLYKNIIDEKFLWKFDNNKYFTKKGYIFLKDDFYQDWIRTFKPVSPDEELLLITAQKELPLIINKLIDSDEIEVIEIGLYKLLLINFRSIDSFIQLNIPIKSIQEFSLVGGIRAKRNTYYSFALPTVKLNEKNSNIEKYKSIFLDSKKFEFKNGSFNIPTNITNGKHCLKLFNSWDSSEMIFYVTDGEHKKIPLNHGWFLDYNSSLAIPSKDYEDIIIDGMRCNTELQWINKTANKDEAISSKYLQLFNERKDILENRFNKINDKLTFRRERYGLS